MPTVPAIFLPETCGIVLPMFSSGTSPPLRSLNNNKRELHEELPNPRDVQIRMLFVPSNDGLEKHFQGTSESTPEKKRDYMRVEYVPETHSLQTGESFRVLSGPRLKINRGFQGCVDHLNAISLLCNALFFCGMENGRKSVTDQRTNLNTKTGQPNRSSRKTSCSEGMFTPVLGCGRLSRRDKAKKKGPYCAARQDAVPPPQPRGIFSYTPEPHIAFCPIFVHPLFPVFEPRIQKWVIFVRRPCVCDTFRFEIPPLRGKKIEFGTDHDN